MNFFIIPTLLATTQAYTGHRKKTWDVPSTYFIGVKNSFAFNGYGDVWKAKWYSDKVYNRLHGRKIITIGGGNAQGYWAKSAIQ